MSLIFNKGSDCRQICNTIPELLSKNLVDAAGGGRREAGGKASGKSKARDFNDLKDFKDFKVVGRSGRGCAGAKKATDILRGFQSILQIRYLFAVRNSTSDLRPTTRLSYSRRPVPPGIRCPQMTFSLRFSNGSTFA